MKKVSLILSTVVVIMITISCGGKNLNEASTINDSLKTKELSRNNEVAIPKYVWMETNLNVDKFRNGDPIPEARTKEAWLLAGANGQPAWCYYDNDPSNGEQYGKLYNWYAVNDPRGLAPEGWHIPSDTELMDRVYYSDFPRLLGGFRYFYLDNSGNENFLFLGSTGSWWSSTENGLDFAWSRQIVATGGVFRTGENSKGVGNSVFCIKDY
jgi:hypothetical protein